MTTKFPAKIDDETTLPTMVDNEDGLNADNINRLKNTIIVIESELGQKPSGIHGTVRNRLNNLDIIIASLPSGGGGGGASFVASGDLSGTTTNQIVVGIRGLPISATEPVPGQALIVNDGYISWGTVGVSSVDLPPIELVFVAGSFSTGLSSYQRIGGRSINMSRYPAVLNGKNRAVHFETEVQKNGLATSVEVQMTDVINGVAVIGTTLSSANSSLTKLASASLTVGSVNGNIRSDIETVYEVRIKMTGGTINDQVYCTNARLLITY